MAASVKSSPKIPSSTVPPPSADTHRPRPEPQPESQPQPQSQPSQQPQSQSQPPPPPPPPKQQQWSESQKPQINGSSYYGYLFNDDKSPTDTLNGLLLAIGQYIIDHIGDTIDKHLNPRKLAAFYHAVGGDYDALFLNSPDRTISYIWQALGVQHTLQPVPDNDYAPPSVPALTLRGFVRWESLQILLGPEEHVPYLQYAVANWNLKHPYTGDAFPVDLPATAFPSTCDPAVDEWHRACGQRLREAATPNEEEEQPPRRHASDSRIPTTSSSTGYGASTANASRRHRPESEYFRSRRPMSYAHVSEPRYPPHASHPSHPIIPEGNHRISSSSGSSLDDFSRRGRSHSDVKPPPVVREDTRTSAHLDPRRPSNVRRHSHSYQSPYAASVPDSESESDTLRASSRHNGSMPQPPPPGVRRVPVPPPLPATTPSRSRRNELRAEDPRKLSLPAELKHKFASFLTSSTRQRSTSREPVPAPHSSVRYQKPPRTRLSRSLSGDSYTSDGSLPEISSKYSSRDREQDRARERIIDRERERARSRELERERERERDKAREWEAIERKSRQEKAYLRPTADRRTSSHADIDRRRADALWEARDRRRESRDLEREVRRNLTSDEMDRRDRRRYQDNVPSPVMTGVSGRRYPR
ncbi:hypothetical protein F5Y01DRAFT_178125 [Xylaria sp. FL0043]|nr:hypothetical protein F5Y01DRAFT_178125 [Xylaria sp. FL0043]